MSRVRSSAAKPSRRMPLINSVLPASRNPAMRYTGISILALSPLQAEQGLQLAFVQLGADDAPPAGVVRRAEAHLMLLGNIVKVQPLAALCGHNALGPEDGAVGAGIQLREDPADVRLGEGLGGLRAPACEHLVGMVVVMVAGAVGIVTLPAVMMVVLMPVVIMVMIMMGLMAARTRLLVVMMVMLVPIMVIVMVVLM